MHVTEHDHLASTASFSQPGKTNAAVIVLSAHHANHINGGNCEVFMLTS